MQNIKNKIFFKFIKFQGNRKNMFDLSNLAEVTENIKSEIKKICQKAQADYDLPKSVYSLWFADMLVLKMTDSGIFISVNTEMQQMTIESKYIDFIKQAVKNIYNSDLSVVVYTTQYGEITDEQIRSDERRIIHQKSQTYDDSATEENYNIFKLAKPNTTDNVVLTVDEIPEFTLDSGGRHENADEATQNFRANYTFDNFIVGGSNHLTYVACTVVAQSPASKYNPLFIHGPSGLGKTHLLYAMANDCARRYKNARIIYVKGEEFTNQLVESLADKDQSQFRDKYRNCDMLFVDDIQFIAGKKSTQEELFHTFNALYEAGKQIVFTSDRPPRDIQPLEDRVTSRFESGLITEIEPPDLELRIAILRRKAKDMNVKVPNDVLLYLAENVTSNIRQIEGAIKKLDAYSDLSGMGEGITLELAKNSITDILSGNEPANVTVEKVLSIVSRKFNVSIEELKGRKRTKEIAFARHVTIYTIRKITDMSLTAIGKVFDRDHSTVMSAVDAVETELKINQELALKIEDIINSVKL